MSRMGGVLKVILAIIVALVAWNLAFSNGAPVRPPITTLEPDRIFPEFVQWLNGPILPHRITEPGVAEFIVVLTGFALGAFVGGAVRGIGSALVVLVLILVGAFAIDYGLQVARDQAKSDPESVLNSPTLASVLNTLLLADSYVTGRSPPEGGSRPGSSQQVLVPMPPRSG